MTTIKNDNFLRALRGDPTDYTPVWIMRQAGRYLPEYRATRAQAGSFLDLCRNPDLACEVTLQPLRRFPLDAAILFSDILTVPDAMGLGLSLNEGVGPRFDAPVRSAADVERLPVPDPETELGYVMDAVRTISAALDGAVPLIGFSGSPWTLATYMVEGGSSKDFRRIKGMIYESPALAHRMLQTTTDAVIAYLHAQIAAGVDAVMVFDTWGGALGWRAYREFSLPYLERIVKSLNTDTTSGRVPVVLFTKGGGQWVEAIAATGCDGIGLDWTASLGETRARLGEGVTLQGNMDPMSLYAPPERIRTEVRAVLDDFGKPGRHVFNLGHGVLPDIDPDRVAVMVEAVHEYSGRR
ncbi:MAG: uroporphyrinogen decarboxylase [Proteobacteria bacterium]|nr:MAG: uroporphyrinogen decarboxylase [Pseudomonadota bacterium]